MIWYVRDTEIRDLITIEEANTVIEEFFADDAADDIVTRPTFELPLPKNLLKVKVGGDTARGVYGFKAYPAGGRHLIVLYDVETGLDAIVEGRGLTELRTGAVAAVATKYLARADASSFGIIGTGREARQQLASTVVVRDFSTVWCYSRTREPREAFAREMGERLGLEVVPVESGEECVANADVVTTITGGREPVLMGSWLREGTHVNAVGATTPGRRELDEEVVGRASSVFVEMKEAAISEIGDLISAVERGRFSWDRLHELKEVVGGAHPGRHSAEEITLCDTVGIGAEDVAIARFAVEKARSLGIGRDLDA